MKSPVLTSMLLLATGAITHAQLSFLPQLGVEQSRTTLQYNAASASAAASNLRAGLKMDYRFKSGHGPFINLGTSPAPINFSFNNDGILTSNNAITGNLRFRMEGGYQYTSKAIQLGKNKTAAKVKTAPTTSTSTVQRKTCGAYSYKPHCSGKTNTTKTPAVNKALNLRLQPAVAMAYVPSAKESFNQTANGFTYNATNWKTAIIPSMGFEFAKGQQRLLTLTVFYTKPLGSGEETVTSYSGSKPVITSFNPSASTWGITAGIPFSLSKAASSKTKEVQKIKEVQKEIKPATPHRRCSGMYSSWQ